MAPDKLKFHHNRVQSGTRADTSDKPELLLFKISPYQLIFLSVHACDDWWLSPIDIVAWRYIRP
jgi:hypothetical protein